MIRVFIPPFNRHNGGGNPNEGRREMKRQAAVLVLLAMAVMVAPVYGGEDVQALKVYFEKAITKEIGCCQKMSDLQNSSSPNIRMKGHREASKALFLQAHKEDLIKMMVAAGVKPSGYQVDRFLNAQFSCNCYAPWVGKK